MQFCTNLWVLWNFGPWFSVYKKTVSISFVPDPEALAKNNTVEIGAKSFALYRKSIDTSEKEATKSDLGTPNLYENCLDPNEELVDRIEELNISKPKKRHDGKSLKIGKFGDDPMALFYQVGSWVSYLSL